MLELRPAKETDLDAVLEIESAWPGLPRWSRPQFERELQSERSRFIVAQGAAGASGYAVAWILGEEVQVLTIAVRPGELRKGLGRRLLRGLLGSAREAGCVRATLEVGAGNEPAAKLYLSEGFVTVGRRRGYYPGGEDAMLMDKAL